MGLGANARSAQTARKPHKNPTSIFIACSPSKLEIKKWRDRGNRDESNSKQHPSRDSHRPAVMNVPGQAPAINLQRVGKSGGDKSGAQDQPQLLWITLKTAGERNAWCPKHMLRKSERARGRLSSEEKPS